MDKKDINYNSILYLFEGNEDCQISALIQEIAGSINDLELDKIDPDEAFDLTQRQQGVAFALGFTFGKMFEFEIQHLFLYSQAFSVFSFFVIIRTLMVYPLNPLYQIT